MGRPKLPDGVKCSQRSIKLSPAEVAFLEGRGGVSRAIHDLIAAATGAAPPAPAGVSPYSGKPLCVDCARKGASRACRKCGAGGKGRE